MYVLTCRYPWYTVRGLTYRREVKRVPMAEPLDLDADEAAIDAALVTMGAPVAIAKKIALNAVCGDWSHIRDADAEYGCTF